VREMAADNRGRDIIGHDTDGKGGGAVEIAIEW
jgi:hypothetical protein